MKTMFHPRFSIVAAALAVALPQLSTLSPQLTAATFTNNTTISETNTAYDGQDIVIDGNVTVTIDGPHTFNSLLLTNGAVLTHSPCTVSTPHKLDLRVFSETAANGWSAARSYAFTSSPTI